MKLSSRFVLDTLFVIAAGFLAVATMAWSIGVAHWVAFAVSVGVLVLAGLSAVLVPTRARKLGHGVIGLVAVWSIIAALVFSGTALTWLGFGGRHRPRGAGAGRPDRARGHHRERRAPARGARRHHRRGAARRLTAYLLPA